MDIRDEVAQTCILIKSIPFETTVNSILAAVRDEVGNETSVRRVFHYTEQADNSTRFIVQLSSRHDVTSLTKANNLYLRNRKDEKIRVEVGFCPECVVPTEWVDGDPHSDLIQECNTGEEGLDGRDCHSDVVQGETKDGFNNDSDQGETTADCHINTVQGQTTDDCHINAVQGEITDEGAVCYAVCSEPDKEPVITKFSEKTDNEEDVEDLHSSENAEMADSVENSQKTDGDYGDVVMSKRRQELLEETSACVLDHYEDQPKGDVYGAEGDVYEPMWNFRKPRPKSSQEPSVTPKYPETGQRSVSVFVDRNMSLTEVDLPGSPHENRTEFVIMSTGTGTDDPEVSRPPDTDRSSPAHNIKSVTTSLKSTNELEATEVITLSSGLVKKIGVDIEAAGSKNLKRPIPSPPLVSPTECYPNMDTSLSQPSTGPVVLDSTVGHERVEPVIQTSGQVIPSSSQAEHQQQSQFPDQLQTAHIVHGQLQTGQIGQGQIQAGQFGLNHQLFSHIYTGQQYVGNQISSPGGQQMHAPYYHYPGYSGQTNYPPIYYQYPQENYQFFPGQPMPMTSDSSPYQAPSTGLPFHPQYQGYPYHTAPPGSPGQMPVTMATSMTRGYSSTNNSYPIPQNTEQKHEKQAKDMKSSLEMEADSLRELEQWAQSPMENPSELRGTMDKEVRPDSSSEQDEVQKRKLDGQASSGWSTDPSEEDFSGSNRSVEEQHGRDGLHFGQMELVIGNLTDVMADVIVNPSNKDLKLNLGFVSNSILQAAGQNIQQECKSAYPMGIKEDMIAVTSGGKLPNCKKIFHVVVPKWNQESSKGEKVLEELVTTCLFMAVHYEFSSIAFPVLGTGRMGYPADVATKAMYESAKKFLIKHRRNFTVHFVVFEGDTSNKKYIQAFKSLGLDSAYAEVQQADKEDIYDVLSKNEDTHLYESLKLMKTDAQPDLSLSTDEATYVDMKDINVPEGRRRTGVRDSSKLTVKQDREMLDDYDAYTHMDIYKMQKSDVRAEPGQKAEESGSQASSPRAGLPETDGPPQYLRVTYPRSLPEDTIKYYFMNRKKSGGGGAFIKFEYHSKKKVTLIQFEDPNALSRVLSKTHKLDGIELQVTKVTGEVPPSLEERKLLISNINPETTYDTLVNFLEVKAKAVPTDVMYGNRKDRAVVSFRTTPDIDMLRSICQTKTLEGCHLKVSRVPVSSTVLIEGCSDVSEDTVMLFFENEKRSGGGEVEKVEILSPSAECLVHFIDPAVARRVVSSKRKLEIEKKAVTASLFYEFLRSSDHQSSARELSVNKSAATKQNTLKQLKRQTRRIPDPPLHASMTLPNPVTLSDVEPNLTKFIMNSKPNKLAFEQMISEVRGKVVWPEDLENDLIRIKCMLDTGGVNAALETGQWSTEIYKNVKKFFGPMTTVEVPVVKKVWKSVLQKLQDLVITHPDGVAIVLKQAENTIVIAGHTKFVEDLKKKVEEIAMKEERQGGEEANQITKSEVLKMFQIQLLWKFKFREEMKKVCPKLEVEIDVDRRKITLTGMLKDVEHCRTEMKVMFESLPTESFAISRGIRDLFFKTPAKTEFVKQITQRHLVVVWDIPPHQDVCVMYAKTSQHAKDAVSIFTKVLKEKKFPLTDDLKKVVASTKWQMALKDLFSRYPEEVQISAEENCVYVTASYLVFDKVCDCIDAEINDYKRIHDTHKEFLQVEEGVFTFLEKYKRYDIETSTLALQNTLNLIVKARNSTVKPGYDIEGTRDAIKLARTKLESVIQKVSMDTHVVQEIGAEDYFSSTEGNDKISQIEQASSSIIRKKSGYRSVPEARGQSSMMPVTKAKCKIDQDKEIVVVEGDMTKLKVDVMVNAANTDMAHGGGIAGAISAAGGPDIQRECYDYITRNGQVPEGEAITSTPGTLPCRMLVHAVGPIWQDGTHNEEPKLQNAVFKSLKLATGYPSIAIPALSAGIFGYPLSQSVENIIKMVQHFFNKYPSTRIRTVYLCDTSHRTVALFIKQLVAVYSPQRVKIYTDTDSSSSVDESSDEDTSEEGSENSSDDEARNFSQENISVRVIRGELAKTKADVLVNSTGRDLQLNVGLLSSSLLRHGGQILQTECSQRYSGGIVPGEVAVTTGGNLQCRKVYHGTFDSWGIDQGRCTKILEKFVTSCLYSADKMRMTSIAFPALGTGRLGYPAITVANVMLACVRAFERDKPDSCLRNVMFVVYPQDKQAVQDFESTVNADVKWSVGATGTSRSSSRNYSRVSILGPVEIEVKQGDITMETTSAIVNSTSDHLDLSRGAVAKAILKAGGQQLQVECNARRGDFQSKGLVATSGGNLSCRYIIHVRSCSRPDDLAQAVSGCLREADRLRCTSLTLPALGTGQVGCPANVVASAIFTSIGQYSGQLRYLKKVRVVIYQADMVDVFKTQLKRHLGGTQAAATQRHSWSKDKKETHKSKETRTKYKSRRSRPSSSPVPDKVQFLMWSDSQSDIRKAKSRIDQACQLEFKKEKVPSSYQEDIKMMNQYQIDELYRLGSRKNVYLDINQRRGEITLQGRYAQTTSLLQEIQHKLYEFKQQKDQVEKAKTVADYVQWVYEDAGKRYKFNAVVNMNIENAYKAKNAQTKVHDSSGVTYVIDFHKMEEYVKDSPHKKFKVERRDLMARSSVGIQLPSTWSPMGKDTYKLVNLSPNDKEYQDTVKAFQATAQGAFVQQIQRIQNKSLYQQYSAKKQELVTRNRQNPEKWLWHGTSPDTVEKIARKGFDRGYCGKNATAYGNGVYFAVNASYSMGYCQPDGSGQKHMFYSRVLTGQSCPGHSGMRYLPDLPGGNGMTYDSATNNVSTPSMYIIFHDSQAYPAYLVSFT
ncbi:protein mono-ADP-ribosyltransferase PARP14-like isoform X2 [Argopecten irradians]|uniref:protein mono-ADP-ribosyltransferase PARP14-like isoform X2 n=1 Tax=Argopecten irradians TaxID=31199 RepID=UPI00371E5098